MKTGTDAKILRKANQWEFNEKLFYTNVTNLHGFKKMDFTGIHSSTDASEISASINFRLKKDPLGRRKQIVKLSFKTCTG